MKNTHRHPRESGGPLLVQNTMDSRFRGNDVIFERVRCKLSFLAERGISP